MQHKRVVLVFEELKFYLFLLMMTVQIMIIQVETTKFYGWFLSKVFSSKSKQNKVQN